MKPFMKQVFNLSHIQTLSDTPQQTTFENIVTKGKTVQDEQLFPFATIFQHYLIIQLSFIEIFNIFAIIFSKFSTADVLYIGTGLIYIFLS